MATSSAAAQHGWHTCGPALSFRVAATSGRARATTLRLPHGPLDTPVFMPVGTQGTVKGTTSSSLSSDPLGCQIILGNTYHLGNRPGTEVLRKMGGLHRFMGWDRNILTDSGGFQMVSLLKLAKITEEGVNFQSPVDGSMMMLTPEESMRTQHMIGSDIMMALDDVVHSCTPDPERIAEATQRTVRWLDRCIAAHKKARDGLKPAREDGIPSNSPVVSSARAVPLYGTGPEHQNLFGIVQGGLDVAPGGLRDQCLDAFRLRDPDLPGYAIGGLAGGEEKSAFWRVVDLCCRRLPPNKPRYLMGVGYPLDLVVCTALGVDMYDCVYPTRTARFGAAFTRHGLIKLKQAKFADDHRAIDEQCNCSVCRRPEGGHYTRAYLHHLCKKEPTGGMLVTHHNIAFMLNLSRDMRAAIVAGTFPDFVRAFLRDQFGEGAPVPPWVKEALCAAGIEIDHESGGSVVFSAPTCAGSAVARSASENAPSKSTSFRRGKRSRPIESTASAKKKTK